MGIYFLLLLLLSLAPQPSLGLGLFHKIWLNFLEASEQFSFLQASVVSLTPNPQPGGLGLCIYIPQRQGGYPFYSPLTTRMGYGRTILIPRSPHGDMWVHTHVKVVLILHYLLRTPLRRIKKYKPTKINGI
jgi:hypothetical protein